MKLTKNTAKSWFTLVELIIVITILAILWTIGFVSFQGYTADARNTKRTSDIASLQSSLETKRAWTSLSLVWFVDDTVTSAINLPANIAGQAIASTWTGYNAWIMNFALLWVWAESFKDPNGFDYSFGATSLKNGQYQFAATLEWETQKALVKWNYQGRTSANTNTDWLISARNPKMFQIKDSADFWKLIVWDTVSDATKHNLIIKSISSDMAYITVDQTITWWATMLSLSSNEVAWLIWDYNTAGATDGTVVVDGSTTTLPY